MEKRQETLKRSKICKAQSTLHCFYPLTGSLEAAGPCPSCLWGQGDVHPGQSASPSQSQHPGEIQDKPHTLPVIAKVRSERSVQQCFHSITSWHVENSQHAVLIPHGCDSPSIGPSFILRRAAPQMLLRACLPKPDDTTAYSREAMPCRIWLHSVVRRIKKSMARRREEGAGHVQSCDWGGLHSSKSERICTLAYQSVTSEVVQVWQILFTRSCLPARTFPATTASSSQLLNYVLSTRSQSRVLAVKPKSRRKARQGGEKGLCWWH